jgi:hypothetical protein
VVFDLTDYLRGESSGTSLEGGENTPSHPDRAGQAAGLTQDPTPRRRSRVVVEALNS